MKLSYTDGNGKKLVYPHEFSSVREALHVAANTGYILDAKELHIADEVTGKKGPGKQPKEGGEPPEWPESDNDEKAS
jgi:hypothetical protein